MIFIDWLKALYACDMRLAGFIWLGIIALGIIFTAVSGGNVKVAKWSIVSVASFYILAKLICGPSLIDTYRMKPMGDAINAYLITKGKPSSLDSIPNLPYKLKCGSAYSCRFDVDGRGYSVVLQCDGYDDCDLELYSSKTKTGIIYSYRLKERKMIFYKSKLKAPNPLIFSRKKTGICNPMRQ
jgi:hypothetical protein